MDHRALQKQINDLKKYNSDLINKLYNINVVINNTVEKLSDTSVDVDELQEIIYECRSDLLESIIY
jgi:peptidoglycan hydrolase CwlO-like protein